MVDFFLVAAGEVPGMLRLRLSEIVCLTRPCANFPASSSFSAMDMMLGST